jgi:hypothetical protein
MQNLGASDPAAWISTFLGASNRIADGQLQRPSIEAKFDPGGSFGGYGVSRGPT